MDKEQSLVNEKTIDHKTLGLFKVVDIISRVLNWNDKIDVSGKINLPT